MRVPFTKMHGAGNDFVVLDATASPFALSREQLRKLGDRRLGAGADQILVVERASMAGTDFAYRIFNAADGTEVEHCGNGARCFVRYVHEKGLSDKKTLVVTTLNRTLELVLHEDGRVSVDMGAPDFDIAHVPFDAAGLAPHGESMLALWPIVWPIELPGKRTAEVAVLSMGNPHAVRFVADVDTAPVQTDGPLIATHARFAAGTNAGFAQIVTRQAIRLRVHERGAGETLACGSGACAAVAAGIRLGLLDAGGVDVAARGGMLEIDWSGADGAPMRMSGPTETVYEGEIDL